MTRFDYIKDKLIYIHSRVTIDSAFKLYDINITAEDMFMHIMNDVYGLELLNANKIKDNFPTVDLIDEKNKIVIQVTSSISTTKINKTLKGIEKFRDDDGLKKYADYRLKFLYIIEDKKDLSDGFKSKNNLTNENFLDITDILKDIQGKIDIEIKVFETLQKIFLDKVDVLEVARIDNIDEQITDEVKIVKDDKLLGIITLNMVPVKVKGKVLNVSIYPVTFEEYDLFCEYKGIEKPVDEDWGREDRPVINVSWDNANEYCQWLENLTGKFYKLLYADEWEDIAKLNLPKENLIDYISCRENTRRRIDTVGSKKSGQRGIYDMPGNIYEWSNTKENESVVVKGGSFRNKLDSFSLEKSILVLPFDSSDNLGFRIVV